MASLTKKTQSKSSKQMEAAADACGAGAAIADEAKRATMAQITSMLRKEENIYLVKISDVAAQCNNRVGLVAGALSITH